MQLSLSLEPSFVKLLPRTQAGPPLWNSDQQSAPKAIREGGATKGHQLPNRPGEIRAFNQTLVDLVETAKWMRRSDTLLAKPDQLKMISRIYSGIAMA
jgi:hypothetical protein